MNTILVNPISKMRASKKLLNSAISCLWLVSGLGVSEATNKIVEAIEILEKEIDQRRIDYSKNYLEYTDNE